MFLLILFSLLAVVGVLLVCDLRSCDHEPGVCQSDFVHVDDDFLREMHLEIRGKFFDNPAFSSSSSSFSSSSSSSSSSFSSSSSQSSLRKRRRESASKIERSDEEEEEMMRKRQKIFDLMGLEEEDNSKLGWNRDPYSHPLSLFPERSYSSSISSSPSSFSSSFSSSKRKKTTKTHNSNNKRKKQKREEGEMSVGAVFLEGTKTKTRSVVENGTEIPFIQDSNFLYLSGANEPDCLFLHDIETDSSFLFVPKPDEFYAIWVGEVLSLEQLTDLFGYTVLYDDEFEDVLFSLSSNQTDPDYVVYTLPDVDFPALSPYEVNDDLLEQVLYEERVIKTDDEMTLMRIASSVSADAHVSCMKFIKGGEHEYSVATHFRSFIGYCGFTELAYETIAGAGGNSAILHYTANNALMFNDQLFLIDAGGQYHGYTSDITRTYPVGGSFSSSQKVLYNMVLNVQEQCINAVAPGKEFIEIQILAFELICEQLILNNFVFGNVSTCFDNEIFSLFMPHGLSHYLGLDVHDTGDFPLSILEINMVLTIEPGIYFNDPLLSPVLQEGNSTTRGALLNGDLIQSYLDMEIGGVRIEDDVVVVDGGVEIISVLPKNNPRNSKSDELSTQTFFLLLNDFCVLLLCVTYNKCYSRFMKENSPLFFFRFCFYF